MDIDALRQAGHPIDRTFLERWSPRAFEPVAIPDEVLDTCFEAARWAPSSMNAQPWRLLYAKREGAHWEKFLGILQDRARLWAQHASALVVFAADRTLVINGQAFDSPTHAFDAGAAWMCFALQATRLGWHTHGVASFARDRINQALGIPDGFTVYAVAAIGRIGDKASLPAELQAREQPSGRRPLAETVMEGGWR